MYAFMYCIATGILTLQHCRNFRTIAAQCISLRHRILALSGSRRCSKLVWCDAIYAMSLINCMINVHFKPPSQQGSVQSSITSGCCVTWYGGGCQNLTQTLQSLQYMQMAKNYDLFWHLLSPQWGPEAANNISRCLPFCWQCFTHLISTFSNLVIRVGQGDSEASQE